MRRSWLAVLVAGGLALGAVGRAEAGWSTSPNVHLLTPREVHTSTLLLSGKVLVTGGITRLQGLRLASTSAAEVFDPLSGTWTYTGSLIESRAEHTATLLRSGKVLVVGGANVTPGQQNSALASAEIFDPAMGVFRSTGSLSTARAQHTATLLSDGKVLVVGGNDVSAITNPKNVTSAELYDPISETWSTVPLLPSIGGTHTATLLPATLAGEGRVLVASSVANNDPKMEMYTYNPNTGDWKLTRFSLQLQQVDTAILLPSSPTSGPKVLLVGGTKSEIWDPQSYREAAVVDHSYQSSTATLLPSGKVIFTGFSEGHTGNELYDPSSSVWTTPPDYSGALQGRAATLLPAGGALVTGGDYGDGVAIYEQPNGSWSYPVVSSPTADLSITFPSLLASGKAIALTVDGSSAKIGVLIFDEASETWSSGANAPQGLRGPNVRQSLLLPSGKLLVITNSHAWTYSGTEDAWTDAYDSADFESFTLLLSGKVLEIPAGSLKSSLLDPLTGNTQSTGSTHLARANPAATIVLSGKVLITGGALFATDDSVETYDPETAEWVTTGRLQNKRLDPTVTLLPSGKVLVLGGGDGQSLPAEIYDPTTGTSSSIASPSPPIQGSTLATVLPSGKVFVTYDGGIGMYNPTTGAWESVPAMSRFTIRSQVLLGSGKVLALGSTAGEIAIYDPNPQAIPSRTSITSITTSTTTPLPSQAAPVLTYHDPLVLEGIGFRGASEATHGATNSSAVDFPLVQLRSVDGRIVRFLAATQSDFSDTKVTLNDLPPGSLDPGFHLLSVIVAGETSDPVTVQVDCRVGAEAPVQQGSRITFGDSATFTANCAGAEHYQWKKDGSDLVGATGPSYTTPPITAADLGSNYSVVCRSSCDDVQNTAPSASIPLAVTDDTAPAAAVLSPNGGEIWVLSSASQTNTQTLTWSMSDNGLICKLVVNLLAVDANGKVQTTILLHSEDKGTACSFSNQVTTTFLTYTVQTTLPAAQGLFYKIEIDVTDQADHTTVAQSTNPFYMVNPATSDSVRTLILSNLKQMRLADADASRLTASLSDLANFANAPGVWFDLRGSTVDKHLLDAWGSCQSSTPPTCDAATANALVSAIRGYIGEILQAYPKLRYVVLVGDDRAIPFARVKDGTTGPAEQDYVPANLTDGSTVGSALEKNFYLSDDVVVSHSGEPFPEDGVDPVSGAFLPDLAVGRLVETPEEIIQTITNFIQQNGVLDLTQTPSPKVLVTGYDFLLDSARAIANDWDAVDSGLLGADWTAEKLKAKLANDHRLFFLNGHAAHFAEGVPGTSDANIPGLSAADIASLPAPGLNGGVVFAVGCHGGLTVPGSTDDNSADHSLDLPQTFLREGAVAYVANSGFGWGLQDGIGYSERLIQLLSDQMRSGGTIAVGDAVRAAKLSYFLQRLAADSAYDQKVLFEWTLFGLPMYAVKTGIAAKSASSWSLPPRKEVPAVEHLGPVTVTRRPATPTANAVPPRFLTQLDLAFDFSGGSVYKKHNAAGNDVTDSGCPQDANGCYYTLNGLSTGAAGLPILPYFVYDSRLSGTSQHGVLWLGGSYVEETGWKPVVAQLISNSGAQTSGGSLPYPLQPHPVSQGRPRPTGANACPASDLDPQSLVVVTGEIASMGTRHRRFDHFNAEILYYNNNDSRENCQQEGPGIAAPVQPYHQVNGSTVTWSVPVTAAGGADVWRVLVLYDLGPDSQGRGAWAPLELAPDGSGNWTGSLTLPAGRGLSYLIEAVSTHGNVGWLASGIEGVSIPTPTAVGAPPTPTIASPLPTDTFGVGDTVVLQGSAVDAQGGALPDSALSWTVLLHQGSQVQTVFGPASGASVSFTAPPPASFAAAVDGYLEIQLKATDAMGQSNTVSQRLDPARVALTFATQPAGLTLTINGAAMVAPQSVTSWRGYPIDLAASTQSGAGGQRYAFQSWSDGGGWSHTLVTPAAPATDTAVFLLSQTTGPLSFFTVLPCRVIDTRLPLGPMGSPSLSAGQVRYFTLPGVCKVPQTARAVAVNVTIVNPTGTGYLTIHPADQPAALTSVLNFTPGMVRANNAILYLGETGTFAVTFVGSPGTVDFVVDLVGFFE